MFKFISIATTLCLAILSFNVDAADCPSAQAIASAAPGALKGTTWAGCDYTKANLSSGLNLENANLSQTILVDANLSNANLNETLMQEANLTNATLVKTSFKESNLTYANLKGANLSSTDLTAADLSNADLTGANIDDANFEYAKLGGATWVTGDRVCKPGSMGECN